MGYHKAWCTLRCIKAPCTLRHICIKVKFKKNKENIHQLRHTIDPICGGESIDVNLNLFNLNCGGESTLYKRAKKRILFSYIKSRGRSNKKKQQEEATRRSEQEEANKTSNKTRSQEKRRQQHRRQDQDQKKRTKNISR